MLIADIHFHGLWGIDDGAESEEMMLEMMKTEYLGGTRRICFTPHYNPDIFPDAGIECIEQRFAVACERSKELFPELELFLGNELCYHSDFLMGIENGNCRTLGKGNCLLVDFHMKESAFEMERALMRVLSLGFCPVLAHAERYPDLINSKPLLYSLVNKGVYIQLNASSVLGEKKHLFSPLCKLIKQGYVHVIASDAHDVLQRPPLLQQCAEFVGSFAGEQTVQELFYDTPSSILGLN